MARHRRPGHAQGHHRRVRDVQHRTRGAPDRSARRRVRRRPPGRRSTARPRDRRTGPEADRVVVHPAQGDHPSRRRPGARFPSRARSPSDADRAAGVVPGGHARDPGGQARPALAQRTTGDLARAGRRPVGPGRRGQDAERRHVSPGRSRTGAHRRVVPQNGRRGSRRRRGTPRRMAGGARPGRGVAHAARQWREVGSAGRRDDQARPDGAWQVRQPRSPGRRHQRARRAAPRGRHVRLPGHRLTPVHLPADPVRRAADRRCRRPHRRIHRRPQLGGRRPARRAGQRHHPQRRTDAPRAHDGHLRTPGRARTGARRDREDHRHASAGRRLAVQRRQHPGARPVRDGRLPTRRGTRHRDPRRHPAQARPTTSAGTNLPSGCAPSGRRPW